MRTSGHASGASTSTGYSRRVPLDQSVSNAQTLLDSLTTSTCSSILSLPFSSHLMPSRLHLKRTPAEQAAHDLRKARKAERRAKKHSRHSSPSRHHKSSKSYYNASQPEAEDDSDDVYGPQPFPKPRAGPSNYTYEFDFNDLRDRTPMDVDEEEIRAQVEEERFREKMFGALEDDERLDSVEARMNDFAHVPQRWRDDSYGSTAGGSSRSYAGDGLDGGAWESVDPSTMDDEEYAEWIRAGMWR